MHINDVNEDKYVILDEFNEEWDKESAIEEYKERIKSGDIYGEDFYFSLGEVNYLKIDFRLSDYIKQHINNIDDEYGGFDPPGAYFSEINELEKYIGNDGEYYINQVLKEECGLDIELIQKKINEIFFESGRIKSFHTIETLDFNGIC